MAILRTPDTDVTMNAFNMIEVDMNDLNKAKINNVTKFIKTRMLEVSVNVGFDFSLD